MKGMKMNKALLPLLLCCFIFPASGKDAGWQWYNEKINPKEKENKPVPAVPRQEPDIMQKLAALQMATKRALYEAILYPGVCNQKPDKKINKTVRREYDLHHFPRLFSIPYCPACFSWSAICSFTFCVRTPLSGIFWLFIRSS